jgi:hypothetical protein
MLKKIKYKLSKLFRKSHDFHKVGDIRLEYAFTIGGVKYYEPTDLNLFPWQRMLAATEAYNKMQLGVREQDIRYSSNIILKLLESDKITIIELMHLKRVHDVLLQRMNSIYRPQELMWDVAAVIFMDETESPYVYDPVYGRKKIEFWKSYEDALVFFYRMPLQRLVPFLPASEENSKLFSETVKELAKIEQDILTPNSINILQKQKMNLQKRQSKSSARGTERK